MKTIFICIAALSMIFLCEAGVCTNLSDKQMSNESKQTVNRSININCSPELLNIAGCWSTQYNKVNPNLRISIGQFTDNATLSGNVLNFVSGEHSLRGASWKMVIGRDVMVPIINSKNPMINLINGSGISAAKFTGFFNTTEKQTWANLVTAGQKEEVSYYLTSNESLLANIAGFAKTDASTIKGIRQDNSAQVIASVEKDIYAIGFVKLHELNGKEFSSGNIRLLPIDKNGNGRLDNFENIYSDLTSFTRGVRFGKYPMALCDNIYATSHSEPSEKVTIDFLAWIMTDGGQQLDLNGFSELTGSKIEANLSALGMVPVKAPLSQQPKGSNPLVILLVVFGLGAITIPFIISRNKVKAVVLPATTESMGYGLNENSIAIPQGLYFDKTHTWAFMERTGLVRIGIDDFLQHVTGTITRVALKNPGEKVRKGEKILTIIRDGKQLDIYAPISGTIREQNSTLNSEAWLVNSAPFTDGWVYMIEPKNWMREIQFMFMGNKYKGWLMDEFTRLRDFVAEITRINNVALAHVVLQDGGELTDNVLADLSPEVWEEFQTQFIDASK